MARCPHVLQNGPRSGSPQFRHFSPVCPEPIEVAGSMPAGRSVCQTAGVVDEYWWLPASAGRRRAALGGEQNSTAATAFRLKPEATRSVPHDLFVNRLLNRPLN